MLSQLVYASPSTPSTPSLKFSQSQSQSLPTPTPFSPSLSLWLQGGVDHADTGSQTTDHGLPHRSTRSRKQHICGGCGKKVITRWEIAYHRLCVCDGGSTSENMDTRSSSSSSSSSKGSGRRWPISRCKFLALVRNKSVPRVDTQEEEHMAV